MGASLPLYSVTDMPVSGRDQHGPWQIRPQPYRRHDPQGVMPNVAGHPTLDASTGMANGVKRAGPAAPKAFRTLKAKAAGGGLATVPSWSAQGIQAFEQDIPRRRRMPTRWSSLVSGHWPGSDMAVCQSPACAAVANVSAYEGNAATLAPCSQDPGQHEN